MSRSEEVARSFAKVGDWLDPRPPPPMRREEEAIRRSLQRGRTQPRSAKLPRGRTAFDLPPNAGGEHVALPHSALDQVAGVSSGFGRYVPYTEALPVAYGFKWGLQPIQGGVRVAYLLKGTPSPAVFAARVAADPARYGYVLHGTTYVPRSLSPGDRQLLATNYF